jgi:hypothetical protein
MDHSYTLNIPGLLFLLIAAREVYSLPLYFCCIWWSFYFSIRSQHSPTATILDALPMLFHWCLISFLYDIGKLVTIYC